jgi:hypothetical protein
MKTFGIFSEDVQPEDARDRDGRVRIQRSRVAELRAVTPPCGEGDLRPRRPEQGRGLAAIGAARPMFGRAD